MRTSPTRWLTAAEMEEVEWEDGGPLVDIYAWAFLMSELRSRSIGNRRLIVEHLEAFRRENDLRREAEEQLKTLAESSPAAILTIDGAGEVLAANRAANGLFAIPEDQTLRGRRIGRYLPVLADALQFQGGSSGLRTAAQCQARREDGEVFLAHNEAQRTTLEKVRVLQRKLYRAAKAQPQRTFGVLFDKVCSLEVLWFAWEQVRRNRGAAGVDGETIGNNLVDSPDSGTIGGSADLCSVVALLPVGRCCRWIKDNWLLRWEASFIGSIPVGSLPSQEVAL